MNEKKERGFRFFVSFLFSRLVLTHKQQYGTKKKMSIRLLDLHEDVLGARSKKYG